MRILVINPNSNSAMTQAIENELAAVKRPDTDLVVTNPKGGPLSIECAYDESRAVPGMLRLVQKAQAEGFDAAVLACFSDPGLDAARELVDIPVTGIQESSMYLAAMLGHAFGVLTTLPRRVSARQEYAAKLGLAEKLVASPVLNIPVAETVGALERMKATAVTKGREAMAAGAEVLILGCAGLGDWAFELQKELGVPVINPNAAGLKMAEAMVDLKLAQSKFLKYQPPREVASPLASRSHTQAATT